MECHYCHRFVCCFYVLEMKIHEIVVVLFKVISTGWRNGQTRMLGGSPKGNVRSCTWGGIIPCTSTDWGLTSWRAALQKNTWECLGGQVVHGPAICPSRWGSQQHPWLYVEEHCQWVKGGDSSLLLGIGETCLVCCVPESWDCLASKEKALGGILSMHINSKLDKDGGDKRQWD